VSVWGLTGVALLPDTGWLYDDAALFGLTASSASSYGVGGWTIDEVAAFVAAKPREDAISSDTWWDVATVALGCAELARMSTADSAATLCMETLETAWLLSSLLPPVLPSVRAVSAAATGLESDPAADYTTTALDLTAAAAALGSMLAEPTWTDPDALAGWTYDAILALARCQEVLRALCWATPSCERAPVLELARFRTGRPGPHAA
jgi:hypothetical protein